MSTFLPILMQMLRFCLVGASGMVIDFTVTWVCKERLRWNKYISNSLGFITAASNNYLWNRLWTFKSASGEVAREYTTFVLIALVGLGLNNLIIYLLHGRLHLNFYLSKLIAIVCVTIWNFGMNYAFTFRA